MIKILLVIDMQNGVCYPKNGPKLYQSDAVIKNINQRIDIFRQLKAPIVFIRHLDEDNVKGSYESMFVPNLHVRDDDIVVEKTTPDSFHHTNLMQVLTQFLCHELEITGAQTEYCIDTTIKVAFDRGYHVSMSSNLVTSTFDNDWMTAEATIAFYQKIWDNHFINFN